MRTAYVRANSVRVSRNRGINESFRAAVDRSYEQRDFPGVSLGHLQSRGNEDQTHRHPDFVIEDLDTKNDQEKGAVDGEDKENKSGTNTKIKNKDTQDER